MLFSTFEFIFLFLPIVLALTIIAKFLPYRFELFLILILSLAFYAWQYWPYLILLISSAIFNYAISSRIEAKKNKAVYIFGIAANLFVLGYFKYTNFFLSNLGAISGETFAPVSIILPLAISFITFEQIAFLSDVHYGKTPRGTFLQYAAFITFFPKLIAGPIIRYEELYPQFVARQKPSLGSIVTGLCIFSIGLLKKVGFSDNLSPMIRQIYSAADSGLVSGTDAVLATLAYTARIYFDFSGYSDMAIGLAWMLGLNLPINFLSPYKATSLIEFWRRWHITLSRFLRDYIYIPLGGNRAGTMRTYINLFAVMVIGGLWHGAGWNFVIWGAIHGGVLVVNHAWRRVSSKFGLPFENAPLSWLLTMTIVVAGWVFFNANTLSGAINIFRSAAFNWQASTIATESIVAIALAWAVMLLTPNTAEIFGYKSLRFGSTIDFLKPIPLVPVLTACLASLAFVASLVIMATGHVDAFIYFQF
jgi:D-alanyl-lipoteichoic acid acyltransferase DltB (MBOAT superfamily)